MYRQISGWRRKKKVDALTLFLFKQENAPAFPFHTMTILRPPLLGTTGSVTADVTYIVRSVQTIIPVSVKSSLKFKNR